MWTQPHPLRRLGLAGGPHRSRCPQAQRISIFAVPTTAEASPTQLHTMAKVDTSATLPTRMCAYRRRSSAGGRGLAAGHNQLNNERMACAALRHIQTASCETTIWAQRPRPRPAARHRHPVGAGPARPSTPATNSETHPVEDRLAGRFRRAPEPGRCIGDEGPMAPSSPPRRTACSCGSSDPPPHCARGSTGAHLLGRLERFQRVADPHLRRRHRGSSAT